MAVLTDIITGKDVVVNGVNQLSRIQIKREVTASPIFHSAGQGGAERAEGNVDFTGFYWAWGHTPLVFPNDTFTLAFSLNGSGGGLTAAGVFCTGIDIVVPTYDPRQQNGVYHVVQFGAGGTDLSDIDTAYTDTTATAIKSVKGLACTFGGSDQTNTQSMKLSIRSMTERTVTSEWPGVYIRPVSNIDWQFTYRRAVNDMALLPGLNTTGALVMEVEAAKNWTLNRGRVVGREALLDHENGELIGADVTIEMCTLVGAVGSIVDPTPTTQWP